MEPHIQVEYDKDFWGGDYSKVGTFSYVKVSEIERLGSVEAAFRSKTGSDPVHIIHYSEDDLYDANGNRLEDAQC